VAAGNLPNNYVQAPGKAHNVITVGASNDAGNPNWSGDSMAAFSAYIDPGNSDREKPEVAAPGESITAVDPVGTDSGTSFAAPQVAGLAAALMNRNVNLDNRPLAMKAILMASAAVNIENSRRLSELDGAGGIDVALAADTARSFGTSGVTCENPCWWHVTTTSNDPSVGAYETQTFKAMKGERIRVAVTWFSSVGSPPPYPTPPIDTLGTNFDLYIWTTNQNQPHTTSVSSGNNYEIVEFVAPETATYTIGVRKQSASEANNQLGIAWSKQATYAPDVRRVTGGGWESTIYVRNNGTLGRPVEAELVDATGTFLNNPGNGNLGRNQVWTAQQSTTPWVGSAIIDGSEDLSVAIANRRGPGLTPYINAAHSGVSWIQADTIYYVPLVMRKVGGVSGVSNTEILIQNLSASSINVTINLYGSPNHTRNVTVPGSGSHGYYLVNDLGIADGWVGSARISTDGTRIAVVAHQQTLDGGGTVRTIQSFNGFPQSSLTPEWGVPIFTSRLANSLSTPVVVQNLGGATIPVNGVALVCTKHPSSPGVNTLTVRNNASISNNAGYFGFNPVIDTTNFPAGWYGSCTIDAGNYNVVGFVQMRFTSHTHAAAYEAMPLNGGVRQLVFPVIQRNNSGDSTAVTVQNLSTNAPTVINFWYYNTNGVTPVHLQRANLSPITTRLGEPKIVALLLFPSAGQVRSW
jgi:hypothetical protein